jgi:hypothetical protein
VLDDVVDNQHAEQVAQGSAPFSAITA